MKNSNEKQALSLQVAENIKVTILPSTEHEFLIDTKEVALGYGINTATVRRHIMLQPDELIEGKHFLKGVQILNSDPVNKTYWTKRGVVRLGFFIKSQQAKLFRDWAEELIIKLDEQKDLFNQVAPTKALPAKRKHNRLTQERMVDILADVCRIDDKELRLSLTDKLMGGRK